MHCLFSFLFYIPQAFYNAVKDKGVKGASPLAGAGRRTAGVWGRPQCVVHIRSAGVVIEVALD
jgi:hypothetical protein